jgi:two-component system chemotaxis sensor kinase CheA
LSSQEPDSLNAGLLDDFFSEADEHMIGIRKGFVSLEESVGKAQPNPRIIEDLFRHFHSLKGISAIVGLTAAEAVAHSTEEFLRLLKSGKVQLTQAGLDVLVSAIQKLEQIVAAFRSGNPSPDCQSLLKNLRKQCAASIDEKETSAVVAEANVPSVAPVLSMIESAKSKGLQIWKYTFTPTQELNAAGVNVNQIRENILKVGEILKSAPQVKGPGLIAFDFTVAARDTPTDLALWESKGVKIEPQEDSNEPPGSHPESVVTEEEAHNPFFTPSHVVRVDLQKLDELMRITGEMVIHRSRLDVQLSRLARERVDLRNVQETSIGLNRALKELRQAIMRVRLVPVAEIFARMPFVIKDLARQSNKSVRLKLEGQETAVDKYLIEKLKDPLLHLVRNAFSHGVETADERVKASKPAEATITLSASAQGDAIIINVSDDGRGINRDAILAKAKKLGFEIPLSEDNEAILKIICASGFSTREDADRASGRGVGKALWLN